MEKRADDRSGSRSFLRSGAIAFLLLVAAPALLLGQTTPPCKDCHYPGGSGPLPHDSGCRNTSCLESCHPTLLTYLSHPGGVGTPLTGERTSTCNTCHNRPFDGVYHPYTINVDPQVATPPGSIDIDRACGQCHSGSGPGPYYTKVALAPVAEGMHDWALTTYATNFAATTPFERFSDAASCQAAGGSWRSGAGCDLNRLSVEVTAAVAGCTGDCTFTYSWDWGDGGTTTKSASPTASHTYALAGTKSIRATARLASIDKRVGIVTRSIVVRNPDLPPVAAEAVAGPCAFDPNSWTYTLTDASTDDGPDSDVQTGDGDSALRITVNWGDGTTQTTGRQGQSFSHVYAKTGTFTVAHTAVDSLPQSNVSATCTATATPALFAISGTVKNRLGTAPLAGAVVVLRKGTLTMGSASTATNGSFSFGSLKPGTYSLTVTKSGYTFATPSYVLGPSAVGVEIRATAP